MSTRDCKFCGLPFDLNDVDNHELTCLENPKKQAVFVPPNLASQVNDDSINCTTKDEQPSATSRSSPRKEGKATTKGPHHDPSTSRHLATKKLKLSSSFSYGMDPKRNLFPPTKKYRYYPVTCEYCRKRFQPTEIKAHLKTAHFKEADEASTSHGRSTTESTKMGHGSKKQGSCKPKSSGGVPRSMRICYICGQMYGTKSLKIHEPKCLDKWRIQNNQLPGSMRAKEPVKAEPEEALSSSAKNGYDVPGYDAANAAAYRSHLKNLIPCAHCSRTFSPDRIMIHQSCCIEKPRTKRRKTPRRVK